MFVHERPVRFEDVDAAGIVFFARYLNYCHEAMEAMFDPLEGGYASLVVKRKIGLPAVHVECTYRAPLRFGEIARIAITVDRIGRSSTKLRYEISHDGAGSVATITHTVALSDLTVLRSIPIPADVRAVLEQHLAPPAAAPPPSPTIPPRGG